LMEYNKSINGLRGFAASAVVVFHIWTGAIDGGLRPSSVSEVINFALLTTQFGVDIFFMISGYLITQSLIRHDNVKSFLMDRVIRIYPAYLPILALLFILGPLVGLAYFHAVESVADWASLLVANVLFLPGVFPIEPALLVAWTLS